MKQKFLDQYPSSPPPVHDETKSFGSILSPHTVHDETISFGSTASPHPLDATAKKIKMAIYIKSPILKLEKN